MRADEFVLSESLGYLANRAARALASDLSRNFAAAGLDITVEQWRVLVHLRDHDGQTQQELSERLLQEKTGVSRLVDGLERRGLVTRAHDPHDRRIRRVFLSDLGRSCQDLCLQEAVRTLTKAQGDISEKELQVCRSVLRRLFRNVAGDTFAGP